MIGWEEIKNYLKVSYAKNLGIFISVIFISLFLTSDAHAGIGYTYDILTNPSNGTLVPSGYPVQRFQQYSASSKLNSIMVEWRGLGGVNLTTIPAYIRDRTTSITYTLNTATASTSAEHPFIKYTPTTNLTLTTGHSYELNLGNYNFGRLSPSSTYNTPDHWDEAGERATWPSGAFSAENYDIWMMTQTDAITAISFSPIIISTCDFSSWNVLTTFSDANYASTTDYSVQVMYGYTEDTMFYQDWYDGVGSASYPWHIPKELDLKSDSLIFARADICNSHDKTQCDLYSSTHIASSDIMPFLTTSTCLMGKVPSQGYLPVTATSTNAGDNLTCDPNSGFFESSMCNLFQTLFKPSYSSLTQWNTLKNTLADKPPFGYFTVYSEIMTDMTSSTSSTIEMTTTTLSFAFLAGIGVWDTIYTAMQWTLWILLLFYLFLRFKNFSLHG